MQGSKEGLLSQKASIFLVLSRHSQVHFTTTRTPLSEKVGMHCSFTLEVAPKQHIMP